MIERATKLTSRAVAALVAVAGLAIGGTGCSSSDGAAAGAGSKAPTSTTTTSTPPPRTGMAVPSPGCSAAPAGAGQPVTLQRRALDVAGTERWYLLTVPTAAAATGTGAKPAPLVLDFHGLAEGAEFHSKSSGYNELAQQKGFVVAFPNGTGQMAAWNIEASGPNPDADYVQALVAGLGHDLCIDTSRVYATGLSNGALLSSVLGCRQSSVFAAVAPVAGVIFPPNCAPDHPMPIMSFHGTADPILRFNGGVDGAALAAALSGQAVSTTTVAPDLAGPGYPEAIGKWAAANGCKVFTDTKVSDTVIHRVWACPETGETEFWIVLGGGHTWPGSEGLAAPGIAKIVGVTTNDISATKESWDFFSRHQRT